MSKISEEVYLKMKKFINEYETEKMVDNTSTENNKEPYVETISIMVDKNTIPNMDIIEFVNVGIVIISTLTLMK